MAAIAFPGAALPFCGGSLIASKWILTAAHCLYVDTCLSKPCSQGEIEVILGEHDFDDPTDANRMEFFVKSIQIHPNYVDGSSNFEHDVALLELATEVDLDEFTPICLPEAGEKYVGQTVTVTGWGLLFAEGPQSNILQEVNIEVVDSNTCATNSFPIVVDAMICAGGDGVTDSCNGDSGGPLSREQNGQHFEIGIVSFGPADCAVEGFPGVYTDVSHYREWIECRMKENGGGVFFLP